MKKFLKEAYNIFQAARAGAVVGGVTSAGIGGIGVAAGGTAVGLTMAPMMAIGAGVFVLGYGVYKAGVWIGGSEDKTEPP